MKQSRHEKIVELIENSEIETQEELADRLREAGFTVTQPPFPGISGSCIYPRSRRETAGRNTWCCVRTTAISGINM